MHVGRYDSTSSATSRPVKLRSSKTPTRCSVAGNERRAIVLQARDRELLKELSILRVMDSEQAKLVGGFHSTTRANTRLLALTRAGVLRRFFLGTSGGGQKALYALSREGARIVDVPFRGPRRRS